MKSGRECLRIVMAGLVPAIHASLRGSKNVDARDKPGHDGITWVRERDPKSKTPVRITRTGVSLVQPIRDQ